MDWFAGLISKRKQLILEIFRIISPKEMESSESKPVLTEIWTLSSQSSLQPCLVWIFSQESLADILVSNPGQLSGSYMGFVLRLEAKTHLMKGLQAARPGKAG